MTPADRELLEHLLDLHDEDDRLLHHDADPDCPRLSPRELDAFRDMLERDFPLSDKQREWVHAAALRLGVRDEPTENTFSGWSAEKRAEELRIARRQPFEDLPRPIKPPGRS